MTQLHFTMNQEKIENLINEKGNREILGFDLSGGESEYSGPEFFKYLKQRALFGLIMVISDATKV